MTLQGKVACITGGAGGIGRACIERFLQEGAKVAFCDLDAQALEALLRDLDRPDDLLALAADVTKRADIERLIVAAVERFGRIDIMMNNAGTSRTEDFLTLSDEDFNGMMAINLTSVFMGTQIAARRMVASGGGVIINVASILAKVAHPEMLSYSVSKAGVAQLTAAAAVALAPKGVRVVGIGPGTIMTDLMRRTILPSDEARRAILSWTPLGRFGEPHEMASLAAFLASEDSSYITGQTIYAEGGRLVLNYMMPAR